MSRLPIKKPFNYETIVQKSLLETVSNMFKNRTKELKAEIERLEVENRKLKELQKDTLNSLLRAQDTNRRLNRRNQELESAIARELKELNSIKLDLRHEEGRIRYWADKIRDSARNFRAFQRNEYAEIYQKRQQELADHILSLLGGGKE